MCWACNRARPARPARAAHPHRPFNILLAEDCLVNQEVAIGLLELQGHTIVVANNGREAVERAQEQRFDVILMDVEMPEMDGLEATSQIRRWEAAEGLYTPIIAMTAHAVRGFQQTCQEAGMDDYVSKPVDANRLFEAVAQAAARSAPAAT